MKSLGFNLILIQKSLIFKDTRLLKQALRELRAIELPPAIPIVVVSTSNNPRDVSTCYSLGAAGYLCKPLSLDCHVEKLRYLTHYWFDAVTLPE